MACKRHRLHCCYEGKPFNDMEIEVNRVNDAVLFEAENSSGNTARVEGSEAVGGEGKGMRPMQLLLASLAGCSAIDVVEILKKQRQPLDDLKISISGERPKEGHPRPFTSIDIHFRLYGDLNETKVARAVKLAVEDYCSVRATLADTVSVNHSFEINPAE